MFDTTTESLEDFDMSWLDDEEDKAYNNKTHNFEQELNTYFGYNSFRDGQKQIIELLANKKNVLASCPTAFGKSICYQLPALMMPGMTVVVSPLISLMKDQVDNLNKKGIHTSGFINSTQTSQERQREIKRIENNETKILYISPERLAIRAFIATLRNVKIALLIVDEAHCISQWGHDFRPDYLNISKAIWEITPEAVGMFTATATEEVKKDIIRQVGLIDDNTTGTVSVKRVEINANRDNLKSTVIPTNSNSDKYQIVVEIANTIKGKGIIYAGTRKKVEEIANHLNKMESIKSDYYHAGRSENERLKVQNSFFSNQNGIQIIVSTNAFGMGIDKADIRYVIHWDMPGTLENYIQEAGRAGRDGEQSSCILLYNAGDESLHEFFAKERSPKTDMLINTYKYIYNCKSIGSDKTGQTFKIIHQDTLKDEVQIPEDKTKTILTQLNRYGLITWYLNMPYIVNIEVKTIKRDKNLEYLASQDTHRLDELCEKLEMNPQDLYYYLTDQKNMDNINFWGKEDAIIVRSSNNSEVEDFIKMIVKGEGAYEKQIDKIEQHMEYIRTDECRAKVVNEYFGEQHSHDCGNCDNCNKHLQNTDSELLFASLWLWTVTEEMKAPPKPVDFTGTHYEDEFDESDGGTEFVVGENGNTLQQETINANTGEPVEWEGDIF